MVKDDKYYFHQTPVSLCKDIITHINFSDDEIVLEPFAGENNFYNNIPDNVEKYRTEIEDELCYKSFDYEGIKPTSILSNPPFRIDGINAFFDILLFFSRLHYVKNIYFLVNDQCVGSLTPIRVKKLNEQNLFLNKKTTINVKKWRGRYYLLHFNRTYNKSFDYFIKNYE
tara:strand:- start:239 stop:748 length:510 start_codon:yes stop_codon:yes gene_type:complete